MKKLIILSVFFTLSFTALSQSCNPDSLKIREVKANVTDKNIPWELQNHQVFYNPDCEPNSKLIVHLVGSFDNPKSTTFFPSLAANNSYKVVVIKYPNNKSATGACGNNSDQDCFWKYRQEIIFGTDTSSEVSVDSVDCVMNRLIKLLKYLDLTYPKENWDKHFTGNNINWTSLLLSGHSQGGGHAAFIAKKFQVNRVLMFASPNDYSNKFSSPAKWVSSKSSTSDSNYYAFGNLNDDVVDYSKQHKIWENMNMLLKKDSIDVDVSNCPYSYTRVLYTKDTSSTKFSGNHNAVIIDEYTPLNSDTAIFLPVWRYMLGICSNTTSMGKIENEFQLQYYPNPTSKTLNIEHNYPIVNLEGYNSLGEQVIGLKPMNKKIKLDLSSYSGILFIKVNSTNQGSKWIKILVE